MVTEASGAAGVGTSVRPRDQWLLAGQELLRRGGVSAVKLHPLAAEAGLTTGSFYHHFAGMKMFLDELASFYSNEQLEGHLVEFADAAPRERLVAMGETAAANRLVSLDAAMRDWAGSSPMAAAAVRRVDERLLDFMVDAFVELGFADREAQVRSQMLLSIGVARVMAPWGRQPDDVELVLDALTGRD